MNISNEESKDPEDLRKKEMESICGGIEAIIEEDIQEMHRIRDLHIV
jgi:hypothetical protein